MPDGARWAAAPADPPTSMVYSCPCPPHLSYPPNQHILGPSFPVPAQTPRCGALSLTAPGFLIIGPLLLTPAAQNPNARLLPGPQRPHRSHGLSPQSQNPPKCALLPLICSQHSICSCSALSGRRVCPVYAPAVRAAGKVCNLPPPSALHSRCFVFVLIHPFSLQPATHSLHEQCKRMKLERPGVAARATIPGRHFTSTHWMSHHHSFTRCCGACWSSGSKKIEGVLRLVALTYKRTHQMWRRGSISFVWHRGALGGVHGHDMAAWCGRAGAVEKSCRGINGKCRSADKNKGKGEKGVHTLRVGWVGWGGRRRRLRARGAG